MDMNENNAAKQVWNICTTFKPDWLFQVNFWEKEYSSTMGDDGLNYFHSADDFLGGLRLNMARAKTGTHTAFMEDDGGKYTLIYDIVDNLPEPFTCIPSPVRDTDLNARQAQRKGSKCQNECSNAQGGATSGCTAAQNEQCSTAAIVLLGCIATCEASN